MKKNNLGIIAALILGSMVFLSSCGLSMNDLGDYIIDHEEDINKFVEDLNDSAEKIGQDLIDSFMEGFDDLITETGDPSDMPVEEEPIVEEPIVEEPVVKEPMYESVNNKVTFKNFPNAKENVTLDEFNVGDIYKSSKDDHVIIDGEEVYVGGDECIGFARYIQYKLYNTCDRGRNADFKYIANDVAPGKFNEEDLKEYITQAGLGAHIRTGGREHSMVVTKITENDFSVIMANGTNEYNKITEATFTWKDYMKSNWAERGFSYISSYDPD